MKYLNLTIVAVLLLIALASCSKKSLPEVCDEWATKACKDQPNAEMCVGLGYVICKHYNGDMEQLNKLLQPSADK